jgi:hypothetical protein
LDKTISEEIEVLLGTPYGTTWELEECQWNMLGTDWEHRRKKTNYNYPTLSHPQKEKKTGPIMSAC